MRLAAARRTWLAEATWAKRVGAPEHAASCLSQALAASPAGRREAILEDLILVAAEAGVDDQLAERIADWRALGPAKTPVQIAGFARAVMEAGAARDAVGQLIDGSAGPGRTARRQACLGAAAHARPSTARRDRRRAREGRSLDRRGRRGGPDPEDARRRRRLCANLGGLRLVAEGGDRGADPADPGLAQ